MTEHGFAGETYTVWCRCGAGFDSVDEFYQHEANPPPEVMEAFRENNR